MAFYMIVVLNKKLTAPSKGGYVSIHAPKSPIYPQKSATYPHKSCSGILQVMLNMNLRMAIAKSTGGYVNKIRTRALSILKRAIYISARKLHADPVQGGCA